MGIKGGLGIKKKKGGIKKTKKGSKLKAAKMAAIERAENWAEKKVRRPASPPAVGRYRLLSACLLLPCPATREGHAWQGGCTQADVGASERRS